MTHVTFTTCNQYKAKYLAKLLDFPVAQQKIELTEIQSLDPAEIVRHKLDEAFKVVGKPVLVEDVSLEFTGLNGLPGPYIKWFLERLTPKEMCALVDGKDRGAVARATFGVYDGEAYRLFKRSLAGTIPDAPRGERGFGWDPIFIPEGYTETRAEMDDVLDRETYLKMKPISALKAFLHEQYT